MGAFAPPLPGQGQGMPSAPAQPQTPGGPPPGLSGLVGGVPNATPVGPTPEQKVQAYMDQIRNLSIAIDALAQQHPEAANDLNDAKNALVNSMSKVASAMTSPEGQPQPQTM
jgi:hypothetical protein